MSNYTSAINLIEGILDSYDKNGNSGIYIFGASHNGKKVYRYLKKHLYTIAGFIDNDIDKQGGVLEDIRIYGINEIPDLESKILVYSKHWVEISEQLDSLGFNNYYFLEKDFFSEDFIDAKFLNGKLLNPYQEEKLLESVRQDENILDLVQEIIFINRLKCSMTFIKKSYILCRALLGYLKGDYSDFVDRFRYGDLLVVIWDNNYKSTILESTPSSLKVEIFIAIKKEIESQVRMACNNRNCRVVFFSGLLSTWNYDYLYDLFRVADNYDVSIVPLRYNLSATSVLEDGSYDFFKSKHYNVVKIDYESKELNEINQPDIIISNAPFLNSHHNKLKITNFPLKTLIIYLPYGIYSSEPMKEWQFNQPLQLLSWKNFVETDFHYNLGKSVCKIGVSNLEKSGYVKMDSYFIDKQSGGKNQYDWKTSPDTKYKVIYAPHHSFSLDEYCTGTFDKNYKFFYELAKRRTDISWVIKPHPLLMDRAVKRGLFKNDDELSHYVNEWDNLPNAKYENGKYFDIFASCDLMVMDCSSFVTEFSYYQKPCIYLTGKGTDDNLYFNAFAKKAFDCLYKCDGEDFKKIEDLIDEILINKNDEHSGKRKAFYDEYLDIKTNDGMLASKVVFEKICEFRSKFLGSASGS